MEKFKRIRRSSSSKSKHDSQSNLNWDIAMQLIGDVYGKSEGSPCNYHAPKRRARNSGVAFDTKYRGQCESASVNTFKQLTSQP
jgi:hypothetical protein